MRHLFGFVLGLVLTPAVVVVPGWALPRLTEITGFGGDFVSFLGLSTVAVLGALALLLGICLALRRVSALAVGIPSLVLLGWTALYVLQPGIATAVLPGAAWGEGAGRLLSLGLYLPVAVPLFFPLVMPSRWRRADAEEADLDAFEDMGMGEEEDPRPPPPSARGSRHAAPPRSAQPRSYGEPAPRSGYPSHRR